MTVRGQKGRQAVVPDEDMCDGIDLYTAVIATVEGVVRVERR